MSVLISSHWQYQQTRTPVYHTMHIRTRTYWPMITINISRVYERSSCVNAKLQHTHSSIFYKKEKKRRHLTPEQQRTSLGLSAISSKFYRNCLHVIILLCTRSAVVKEFTHIHTNWMSCTTC